VNEPQRDILTLRGIKYPSLRGWRGSHTCWWGGQSMPPVSRERLSGAFWPVAGSHPHLLVAVNGIRPFTAAHHQYLADHLSMTGLCNQSNYMFQRKLQTYQFLYIYRLGNATCTNENSIHEHRVRP